MSAVTLPQTRAATRRSRGFSVTQPILYIVLTALAFLNLFPIYYMLVNSVKTPVQFAQNAWLPPDTFQWNNYARAWEVVDGPMINTLIIVGVSVVGIVIIAALSSYAFAVLQFPGRNALFMLIFILLLIPSFLTLIPLFLQIKRLQLTGYLSVIPAYIAAGQALSIFILTMFFRGISKELLEAARIDGANEFRIFTRLVLPLSGPALVSVAVINFVALWNDYLLPRLLLEREYSTLAMALVVFQGSAQSHSSPQFGPLMATYVFMAIPLALLLTFLMRRYVEGLTSGALKA